MPSDSHAVRSQTAGLAAIPQPVHVEAPCPVHLLCCLSPLAGESTNRPDTYTPWRCRYVLTSQGTLKLMVEATTDKGTIINLAQHSYFNMAGHASGTILDHELTINGCAPALSSCLGIVVDSCHWPRAPAAVSGRKCGSPAGRGL